MSVRESWVRRWHSVWPVGPRCGGGLTVEPGVGLGSDHDLWPQFVIPANDQLVNSLHGRHVVRIVDKPRGDVTAPSPKQLVDVSASSAVFMRRVRARVGRGR